MDAKALQDRIHAQIQALKEQGFFDGQLRFCYTLKSVSGRAFFTELVTIFVMDGHTAVRAMSKLLEQPTLDYDKLFQYNMKLKGSAMCIGACRVTTACSNLCEAIDSRSKDRFYASEVVAAALEYLHMMRILYRDLKLENVLVRSDGHIMLTDFDLSLRCHTSASTTSTGYKLLGHHAAFANSSCILPTCIVPAVSCFQYPRRKQRRDRRDRLCSGGAMVEIMAEPVEARSMSFVGTHDYLAPEIVAGEGHGNAVDWWTLGVFMFELWYGVTPFKGGDHELTLANIVARALEFPKEPAVTTPAKDLMTQLMAKDPTKRLGSATGATAIKRHPFFAGVNWALLRCTAPPFLPHVVDFDIDAASVEYY